MVQNQRFEMLKLILKHFWLKRKEIVIWYNEPLWKCDENILDAGMTFIALGLNLKAILLLRCEFHKINSDVNWIRFLIWPHPYLSTISRQFRQTVVSDSRLYHLSSSSKERCCEKLIVGSITQIQSMNILQIQVFFSNSIKWRLKNSL